MESQCFIFAWFLYPGIGYMHVLHVYPGSYTQDFPKVSVICATLLKAYKQYETRHSNTYIHLLICSRKLEEMVASDGRHCRIIALEC